MVIEYTRIYNIGEGDGNKPVFGCMIFGAPFRPYNCVFSSTSGAGKFNLELQRKNKSLVFHAARPFLASPVQNGAV